MSVRVFKRSAMLKTKILLALAIAPFIAPAGAEIVRLGASTPSPSRGAPYTQYLGGGVKSSVYDGLTQISSQGKVEPALALEWTMPAPTRWRFTLRPGVIFQNGERFDADSVAANFQYLKSEAAQAFYVAREMSNVVDVRPIDRLAIEFDLRQPDPLFPQRLSLVSMVEPRAWAALGPDGYAAAPVGTGPFRVTDWGTGANQVILEAFDKSWRRSASVDKIEMITIPNTTSRFQALMSGRIDIAVAMDPDTVAAADQAGLKTLLRPRPLVLAFAYKTLRNERSPLGDARVRRALNYAVDKQSIADNLLLGTAVVASQEVTQTVTGYNPKISVYPYDPDKARGLLREAGFGEGFALTFAVFGGQVSGDTLIFQRVSQDLAKIGVRLDLRMLPFSDFSRRRASGDWDGIDGVSTVWSSLTLFDALFNLDKLTCRLPDAVFCDAALIDPIDRARIELDPARRTELLQDLMARVHDLAPSLLLFENADIVQVRPHIQNYGTRSDGILFDQLHIER